MSLAVVTLKKGEGRLPKSGGMWKIPPVPLPVRAGKAVRRHCAGTGQDLFQKRAAEALLYGDAGRKPPAFHRKRVG